MAGTMSDTRIHGIDFLRGVAVLLVLGRHFTSPELAPEWMRAPLAIWHRGGWVGVDLFFVLSGFLVSELLFSEFRRHGRIDVLRFYVRRGFKIYPGFYLLLLATLLMTCGLLNRPFPLWRALSEAFFVQNYLAQSWGTLWNHTWSLAVEEHFYFALPIGLFVLSSIRRTSQAPFSSLPILCIATAIALTFFRFYRSTTADPSAYSLNVMQFVAPTHLRADSLLAGVCMSYYWTFHRRSIEAASQSYRLVFAVVGVALLAPAFMFSVERTPWLTSVGFTLFYCGSSLLLVAALTWRNATRSSDAIARVGHHSYSVYLWHMPVQVWLVPLLFAGTSVTRSYPQRVLAYLVLSLLVGFVMARIVEMPLLRLRDRLWPSASLQGNPTAHPSFALSPTPA